MNKDFEIENEKMYTIREAAEICGVSRATLLRMEEGGFDSPRFVDERNGYRYYDVVNIHRIKLYQMLQMGQSLRPFPCGTRFHCSTKGTMMRLCRAEARCFSRK